MENRGYFIIDGSHLFSSIHEIWRTKPDFKDKKLNLGVLTEALTRKWSLYIGATIRVIYYFKQNDKRLKTMLIIPEVSQPGEKDHWQIKECGESIKAIPNEELQKISPQYRDHFTRAEKGLDIKLTCDVLLLVSSGRTENIVFLVNDRDYIPLFEAIQYLGGNVYLTALDRAQEIQNGLARLSDKYLTLDSELENIFGVVKQPPRPEPQILQQEEKPSS